MTTNSPTSFLDGAIERLQRVRRNIRLDARHAPTERARKGKWWGV
ncbi:MAG: hypothetical protein WBN61_12700 [Woeseiaceae bacterium]